MDPCESGWSAHGGNCYKIFSDWRTWYNSMVACRQLGGDLASITSSDEQSFVAGTIKIRSSERNAAKQVPKPNSYAIYIYV